MDQEPFRSVFARAVRVNAISLDVELLSDSAGQEITWWVWHCHQQGSRRINPGWLRGVSQAISYHQVKEGGEPAVSILDLSRRQIQHAYQESVYSRRGRLPAASNVRCVDREVAALQEALALRHDRVPWWELDAWKCRDDPRIPVREHEPQAGVAMRFTCLRTPWLRQAGKFYFRVLLETGQQSWGTLLSTLIQLKYFDEFLISRALADPALVADPSSELHALMLEYLSVLRSRTATVGRTRGQRLADRTVVTAQLGVAAFYVFLVDHRNELVSMTGDQRYHDLTDGHARLWRTSDLPWGGGRVSATATAPSTSPTPTSPG